MAPRNCCSSDQGPLLQIAARGRGQSAHIVLQRIIQSIAAGAIHGIMTESSAANPAFPIAIGLSRPIHSVATRPIVGCAIDARVVVRTSASFLSTSIQISMAVRTIRRRAIRALAVYPTATRLIGTTKLVPTLPVGAIVGIAIEARAIA